ncbi:MAG: glutamate 5-kinase [Planctomycetota bacterium]
MNESLSLRQSTLRPAKRVVVKIGSALLTRQTRAGYGIRAGFIREMVRQIVALRAQGRQVTLVSSGAVAAGCVEMGKRRRPTDVAELQALAAIGQRRLMSYYHQALRAHRLSAGQLLLSREDFDARERFLNIRNCVLKLHEMGAIPVLNENDAAAVDEIRFGDNDLLAAMMTNALGAQALVLLTVVDGVLDPRKQVIDRVEDPTQNVEGVTGARSAWGSGGMRSKLDAARLVAEAGEAAVIANGNTPNVLLRVLAGESVGTLVVPASKRLAARSRWIGLTARPSGFLTLDDGAAQAVLQGKKSLLASGVSAVTGRFERGEVLVLRDPRGRELARGLSNYSSTDLQRIAGLRSAQIASTLGRPAYKAVVHRDNLVIRSPDGDDAPPSRPGPRSG